MYKDAGADVIFVEAPQSADEMRRIAKEVPQPVVINNIEGGVTPALPLEELHAMGFSNVGFVLTGARRVCGGSYWCRQRALLARSALRLAPSTCVGRS